MRSVRVFPPSSGGGVGNPSLASRIRVVSSTVDFSGLERRRIPAGEHVIM